MKKFLFFILVCFVPVFCYAADVMCVKPATTVVVLDVSQNGTVESYDATNQKWAVRFDYGVIRGTCDCTTSNIKFYQCKMLYPVESSFVSTGAFNCRVASCAQHCADSLAADTSNFRQKLFDAISIQQ